MESNVIDVVEVLELFKKGVARYKSQDQGLGSIEEKFNLSPQDCELLFSHHKIKGKKVTKVILTKSV